eukprot:EG_transcript_35498
MYTTCWQYPMLLTDVGCLSDWNWLHSSPPPPPSCNALAVNEEPALDGVVSNLQQLHCFVDLHHINQCPFGADVVSKHVDRHGGGGGGQRLGQHVAPLGATPPASNPRSKLFF